MRVLAVARGQEALAALKTDLAGDISTVAADATQSAQAVEIIQRERPTVLVLNAGSSVPIQETRYLTWEAFSANWNVDVKGTFIWAREALLAPLDPGSTIIVVASTAARATSATITGYISAKAAQVALAKCLAVEAEPLGIRVHYLLPTLTTQTDLGHSSIRIFARRRGMSETAIIEDLGITPLLTPEIIGKGVVQLLTDAQLADTIGFRISGLGLEPLDATASIMTA